MQEDRHGPLKPQDRNSLLLPVVLSAQIIPDSFAFALNYLLDHELDLGPLDDRFKIVLLA